MLHNTLADSAHLAGSVSTLFGYLPLQFGLNLAASKSYSESSAQTATMTRTKSLALSLLSGNVEDESDRYRITTYIYYHAVLGCLCIGYEIATIGAGWARRYSRPTPMLIKPFRRANDKIEGAFSRAISFEVGGDQTVKIRLDIFNCSLGNVSMTLDCECYRGKPALPDPSGRPVPTGALIGSMSLTMTNRLERRTVFFDWPDAKAGDCVTVKLIRTQPASPASVYEIGWNVYPESEYARVV